MPGRTLYPPRSWHRLSIWQVRFLAVLVGAGVAFELVFIGYLLLYELASPGKMIVLSALFTGTLAALFAFTLMSRARERQARLLQWVRLVRDMNHHTRNALEQINYSAYSTGDQQLIAAIRAGVGRIEWALHELMAPQQESPEADSATDTADEPRGTPRTGGTLASPAVCRRPDPRRDSMNRARASVIAGLGLLLAWSTFAFGQKDVSAATPKYDVASETTLKGTVAEVKQLETARGEPAIHLMLKTGDQVLEIFLCPNAFLKEMEMGFAQGDQVQVTGSKVKVNDLEVILAREVTKGQDTLILRDKKGAPVWTPAKRG